MTKKEALNKVAESIVNYIDNNYEYHEDFKNDPLYDPDKMHEYLYHACRHGFVRLEDLKNSELFKRLQRMVNKIINERHFQSAQLRIEE